MARLLLTILLLPFIAKGQGSVNYNLTILNNKGGGMSNTPVTLIETNTKRRISKNTDASGKVNFMIDSGEEWKIQILKINNIGTIEVPKNGKATGNKLFTYDYDRWARTHRDPVNRKLLGITTIDQTKLKSFSYNEQQATVKIEVKKLDKSPLTNFPIQLTCYKLKNSFLTTTNSSGIATFMVPVNNEFEIDIDGVESFNYIDIFRTGEYGLNITYEPTDIKEINKNDTITQSFKARSDGTSGRTLVNLTINCTDCDNLSKEPIYIQEIGGSKVYTTVLNKTGNATFLLPVKKKYMVSFLYDFDVDVINLSEIMGISIHSMTITYRPRPELKYPERYLPSPVTFIRSDLESYLINPSKSNSQSPIIIDAKWGNENINSKSKEALLSLQLSIKAPKNSAYVSPPVNISFVLDKSGSMEGNDRINKLKESMLNYSSILRPTDRVSLIAFDDKAQLIMPNQLMNNKSYFTDMIKDLSAGGGTNIFSGLEMGYKEVLKNVKPQQVNRVILLTDGYDGIPVDSTIGMSKRYNQKGIKLSAIGVGNDYNYSLLNLLALNGGGALRLSPKPTDLNIVIQQELNSIIQSIGSNARVSISFGNEFSCKETFGMPLKKESEKLYSTSYPELYDGQNNLGLLKFNLNNPSKQIEKSPITIKVTYYDFVQKKDVTIEEKIFLKWQEGNNNIDFILDSYIKKLYSIAYVNHALKRMEDNFTKEKYASLSSDINNLINTLENYYAQPTDEDIIKLLGSLKKYTSNVDIVVKNKAKKKSVGL